MATAATSREAAEEATLAKAFARREGWAFDEAYRRYGSLLFSVAMNVLQNAEDAEDCVHDVLVRVWKSAHTFAAERGSVRAFLVVCVRNDAISRVRSAARRARLSERVTQETALVDELPLDDFVERGRLREAIAQLPEEQKKAVLLAFFGGKTHVEIARDLAEPLGTVKSRISLGLRKLGNALRGGGEG